MQISKILSEGLKQEYKVVVPAADINNNISKRLSTLAKKIKLPGFRPGMVPASVVKQRYGAEATQEVIEEFVNNSIRQIVKDNSLKHSGNPQVQIDRYEPDKDSDLELKVQFEILPDIELQDFKAIQLEKLSVEIPEKQVNERIDALLSKHKKYEKVDEGYVVKEGDLVHLDIEGKATLNDKPFKELGKHIHVVVGKENPLFTGKIEKELLGKKQGDVINIEESLPSDYRFKEIAGKTFKAQFKLGKIEQPIKFKLDDTFAKEFKCDTVDDLKKSVREVLENEYKSMTRILLKRRLLDALSSSYNFDLPPSLVENEFKVIWNQLKSELEKAESLGELEDDDNRSEEELEAEYKGISERRVRLGLLISEISQAHKIKVDDTELRQAILREAQHYPNQEKEVINHFRQNRDALNVLGTRVLEDKVVDFILEQATIVEKKVSPQELKKEVSGVIPGIAEDEDDSSKSETKEKKPAKAASKTKKAESSEETSEESEKAPKKKAVKAAAGK